MTDYTKLVEALRRCSKHERRCLECEFLHNGYCSLQLDAADAIEALETEVKEAFNRGYNAGYVAGVDNCTSKLKKELDKAKMEMQDG